MSGPVPSRLRAALSFALVGLLAGTAHVLAHEPESPRLWREVLPLACIVGAVLGALFRPSGWFQGLLVALLALPGFAIVYAVAETAMMAGRGEIAGLAEWPAWILHWTALVLTRSAVGGLVAIMAGAAAGWLSKR